MILLVWFTKVGRFATKASRKQKSPGSSRGFFISERNYCQCCDRGGRLSLAGYLDIYVHRLLSTRGKFVSWSILMRIFQKISTWGGRRAKKHNCCSW